MGSSPEALEARRRAGTTAAVVLGTALMVQVPALRTELAGLAPFGPETILRLSAVVLAGGAVALLLASILDEPPLGWGGISLAVLWLVFGAWDAWWGTIPALAMVLAMGLWQTRLPPREKPPAAWRPGPDAPPWR